MSWSEMAKAAPLAGGHGWIANSFEGLYDGGEPTEVPGWCQIDTKWEAR